MATKTPAWPCWTASLTMAVLAVALAVAGAVAVPKADDDVCNNSTISCLDSRTRVVCADLGSGLMPVSKFLCPDNYPVCKKGLCVVAPPTTTTTTATTTTTLPPDPCAGRERSCVDAHTLRVCADLGAGLVPVKDVPCSQKTPLCVLEACVAAPTSAPTSAPTAAPTNPATTPAAPTTTQASTLAPSSACRGQTKSCLDDSTVLECGDLGYGLVPLKEVQCSGRTPACRAGQCVAAPSTTPPPSTQRPTTAAPEGNICQGKLSVCGDCYTRTTCARLGKEVVPVSNTTCPADKPYCVAGACEPDLPSDSPCAALPAPASSFKCYADGYYPDPSDCRRFHLCVGDKAYDYDCTEAAAGLIYDQARALCVPLGQAQCFAFDCRGRANTYQTYRPDPTIYALCVTEDSDDALLARCPAGYRLAVDPNDPLSVSCQPFCARAGRTADPDDASGSSFYECFATSVNPGDRLVGPLKGSCPQGSVFDAASERCHPAGPTKADSTTVITVVTTPSPPTTKQKSPWPWW